MALTGDIIIKGADGHDGVNGQDQSNPAQSGSARTKAN